VGQQQWQVGCVQAEFEFGFHGVLAKDVALFSGEKCSKHEQRSRLGRNDCAPTTATF
jgi:hypothetical protein